MVKRKLELSPDEIALKFKKNKYDNANGVLELLIRIQVGTSACMQECLAALTSIALKLIADGDTVPPTHPKPDDLKDAGDKYQEWIRERFEDIVEAFIKLLHHQRRSVSEAALTSLMRIIELQARTELRFPVTTYEAVVTALLSSTVDCTRVTATLKPAVQHLDLLHYTFMAVDRVSWRRGVLAPRSDVFKGNLVAVVLLLQLSAPPTKRSRPSLWCSVWKKSRRVRPLKGTLPKELPKSDKEHQKKVKKMNREAKNDKFSKSRYEAVMNQTLAGVDALPGDEPGDEAKDEADDKPEDEFVSLNGGADVDSDEEQRRRDDHEFKSGQKVKKPRISRRDTIRETRNEQEQNYSHDNDLEEESISETKRREILEKALKKIIPLEKKLLPVGLFGKKEDEVVVEAEPEKLDTGPEFVYRHKILCECLSNIWKRMMLLRLTEDQYKRCLVFLPDKVLQYLKNPLSLTDFFLTSYDLGGGVSLMAMHGVFVLITKYNLEYPDFFSKVYALLEPAVFSARYKGRFFLLLDIFLRSSHLPEFIAAAFAKKLARLLLVAPAHSTLLLVKCINNILARFPTLRKMYDDDEDEQENGSDPYDVTTADLSASQGSSSSLWEVDTVGRSAPEKLYKAAGCVKRIGELIELDLSANLETDYDELDPSTAEYADNIKKVSENFRPLEGLLNSYGSSLHETFECY